MRRASFLKIALVFVWLSSPLAGDAADDPFAASSPTRSARPETIRVQDTNGTFHTPFDARGRRAAVLFFALPDCPISNAYSPEIRRVAEEYAPKGFRFYLVHVDPTMTSEAAKQHRRDYRHGDYPVLLDRRHELAKHVGVDVVPEAAIVGKDGQTLYRGRIDNLYAGYGKRRRAATTRDLRAALDSVLAGQRPKRPWPKAVGCYLPPLD